MQKKQAICTQTFSLKEIGIMSTYKFLVIVGKKNVVAPQLQLRGQDKRWTAFLKTTDRDENKVRYAHSHQSACRSGIIYVVEIN